VKPTIGITSGDPRGIGLEVALKALPHILPAAHWVLFTDREAFASNAGFLDGRFVHRWVEDPRDVRSDGFLHLVSVSCADPRPGARALRYLEAAGDAAMAGAVQAIVTAPVSKEAIGGGFTGQTDWLAARAGIARYAMAFFTPTFKVVLATVHMTLRQALDRISEQLYVDLIPFIDAELRRLGFPRPRIAVAAVNPHAGEGGLFGREDQDLLRPAVDRCRAMGLDVSGPYSARPASTQTVLTLRFAPSIPTATSSSSVCRATAPCPTPAAFPPTANSPTPVAPWSATETSTKSSASISSSTTAPARR
jgi:4-hydroxythreonine-4-phosphate dehydrogenase